MDLSAEWGASVSTRYSVSALVEAGVLREEAIGGWRLPGVEDHPVPEDGEIVVFEDFFKRGLGVPVHPFLIGLCSYYQISIHNLSSNSVLLVAIFVHFCEIYLGVYPHFDLFRYLFKLRRRGGEGGSRIAGSVSLSPRDGVRDRWLGCPFRDAAAGWIRRWFYVHAADVPRCDVVVVPERLPSWEAERPECSGEVAALMGMIPVGEVDGPGVVGNFFDRRVQVLQRRLSPGWQYQGVGDVTRMSSDELSEEEVTERVAELFDLRPRVYRAAPNQKAAFSAGHPLRPVSIFLHFLLSCCSSAMIWVLMFSFFLSRVLGS